MRYNSFQKMEKTVVELFAGVGGFRVGLNNILHFDKNGHAVEQGKFSFVWSNQWEPSTRCQQAFECYSLRFPDKSTNINEDISHIDKKTIPDHTLLVGGFPCQDYSVAHSLSKEKGIEGKKGVLWWQINDILKTKKPPFVLLENVDRLIKSPAKQRGRDFGIMLRCFSDQGYGVEWRVINAADYGHPQRRRRIYIFAFHNTTNYYKKINKNNAEQIIEKSGLFIQKFPILNHDKIKKIDIYDSYKDLVSISDGFTAHFENCGFLFKSSIYTCRVYPKCSKPYPLNRIIEKDKVEDIYYLSEEKIKKFQYLRGKKRIERKKPDGKIYYYSEGSMSQYDDLSLPARTMLTSEGTTNRSTHIIKDPKTKKYRLLTPIECERINQFPDNWTKNGMSKRKRCFMMGNALVCGIINKIGKTIAKIIDYESANND